MSLPASALCYGPWASPLQSTAQLQSSELFQIMLAVATTTHGVATADSCQEFATCEDFAGV
jgi:hypothetical protein